MKHLCGFLLAFLLVRGNVWAQISAVDDDFELDDPCTTGEWDCRGSTRWIAPDAPACDPLNPNTTDICNLYDPGEGYVRVTPAIGNQFGTMFRTEKLLYNNFRMTAVVEIRDGSIGRPADGMAIIIVGTPGAPSSACAGGALGAVGYGPYPSLVFEFDNWDCNPPGDNGVGGAGPPDANHVAFVHFPNGTTTCDALPAHAFAHVPFLLNNKEAPPASANRFLFQVQIKNALVTCDLANNDVGMPKTRMYTYKIPDFEPFEGFLGMAAATGGAWQNHIMHSIKIEDITGLCLIPPATGLRNITNLSRADKLPVYNTGDNLKIEIELTDLRGTLPEEDCGPATELTITETLPATWVATGVSDGGTFAGGVVKWVLRGAEVRARKLSYQTVALTGDFRAIFSGQMQETNIQDIDPFGIGGDVAAILDTPFAQGFISQWLLLGPYTHVGFDSPGSINLSRDYLTDGAGVDEFSVVPKDGDVVNTNFNVAASNGYQNPLYATPTWQSWANTDEATLDLIDLNTILSSGGDPNNVMAYAVAYVNNLAATPRDVNMELASDDSISVSIGRCQVYSHSIPRGSGAALEVQDTQLVTLEPGVNRVLVKVWDGGGGWNFRLRFSNPADGTPLESADLGLSLDPGNYQLGATESCPIPIISAPQTVGKAPLAVNLSGARSLARAGKNITAYEWNFGDTNSGSGKDVAHTYTAPGNYTVELTVTDSTGATATAGREVHVAAGGIVFQGNDLDTMVPTGAGTFVTTADGLKSYESPPGDDLTVTSFADFAVEITALPAGETEFPVAILLRNVGDHKTGFTIGQRTTGVTSSVGFATFDNGDATNPTGIFGNVLARDNTGREDAGTNDADGNPVQRTEDPTLADAYSPFSWAQSVEAKLKLQLGINLLRADNRMPPAAAQDNGNQVAAIVIGGDSPGLVGRVVSCPVQPTGLKATADPSFCQITVDWSDNPGSVSGYNVYRAPASAGPYEKIATVNDSQYVDQGGAAGLTAGTPYFYKVSAQLPECESSQTTSRTTRTAAACTKPPEPPQAPRSLSAAGGQKQIALTWLAPAAGTAPTGYRVLRSNAPGGPYAKVADVPATPTSYTDSGLQEDTSYCYVVQSLVSSLTSANSNEDCDKTSGTVGGPRFRRGDVDATSAIDINDPVLILGYLFLGAATPQCLEAADTDDNGEVDITDAVNNLGYQFLGGPAPDAPGPINCGLDASAPFLGCNQPCP